MGVSTWASELFCHSWFQYFLGFFHLFSCNLCASCMSNANFGTILIVWPKKNWEQILIIIVKSLAEQTLFDEKGWSQNLKKCHSRLIFHLSHITCTVYEMSFSICHVKNKIMLNISTNRLAELDRLFLNLLDYNVLIIFQAY